MLAKEGSRTSGHLPGADQLQVPGMKNVVQPQPPEDLQHALPILAVQEGHDDALRAPPDPDDEPEPLEELEPPPAAAQDPPLQSWPDTHMLQASPPEPQALGSVPPWQVLVESQQPAHVAPEHPPTSSPPPDPLSSPTTTVPLSSGAPEPLLLVLLVVA